MKKTLLVLLCLALLACLPAAAIADTARMNAVVARESGPNTVYIGENNYLYEFGAADPLCEVAVCSVVYADKSLVMFTAPDTENAGGFPAPRMLYTLPLNGNEPEPQFIATTTTECVYIPRDGLVYYIDQQDDSQLLGFNPLVGSYEKVADLAKGFSELSASIDGLVGSTAGGDLLFVPSTGEFVNAPLSGQAVTVQAYNGLETLLDADGNLSLRAIGQPLDKVTQVDGGVLCSTAVDGIVYYLKAEADGTHLYEYDYSTKNSAKIDKTTSAMCPVMASNSDQVFLLAQDGRIFSMTVDAQVVEPFENAAIEGKDPVMTATANSLLLYDASGVDGMLQFMASYPFESAPDIEELPPSDPAAADEPEATEATEPTEAPAEPAEPRVLSRGSRGADVKELQEILKEQGYPVGTPDGIFGAGTATAVRYLQGDMGKRETGKVTEAFLAELKDKKLPEFHRYVELRKGDSGIRVYEMQARLHQLSWLKVKADGDYGSNTVSAVKAAEKALGEKASGAATVKFLEHLFKKDMLKNPETTDIKPTGAPIKHDKEISEDDLIELVRWMNNRFPKGNYDARKAVYTLQKRLVDMGYLKKSQCTKNYDRNTFLAIKHVQNENDLLPHPTGKPDQTTLAFIFPENRRAW